MLDFGKSQFSSSSHEGLIELLFMILITRKKAKLCVIFTNDATDKLEWHVQSCKCNRWNDRH